MQTTLLLSKALGLYLLVMSVALLCCKDVLFARMRDMVTQPGLALFSAIFTLMLGAFLVAAHNHWVAGWPVIVTVLAWVIFIKGTVRVLFPQLDPHLMQFTTRPSVYVSAAIINLVVALFLLYKAYVAANL